MVCSSVAAGMVLLSELSLVRPQMQSIYVCQKRELSLEDFSWREGRISDFWQLDVIKNTSFSAVVRSHSCVAS